VFEAPDAAWKLVSAGLRILTYAAALLGSGGALFLLLFRQLQPALRQRVARVAAGCSAVGLIATTMAIPVQTGYLAGAGPEGMLNRELLGMVAGSPVGIATGLAAAGWILLMFVLARGLFTTITAATGGVLVIAALTVAGHGAAEAPILGRMLVGIHLIATAFWIGALWPLLQVARHAPRSEAAEVLHRFGTTALVMVGMLVAAGIGLALLLLGNVEALWSTAYGRVLSTKLVLVAALMALAALNRLRLVPRFAAGADSAPVGIARSIRAECAIASLVVVATAILTTYTTPFT
jgi:putative copper resistance protein D